MKFRSAVAFACLAGALPALADTFVVPPAYQNTVGTGTFLGPLATSQRAYQLLIHEDQLVGMVGFDITGLTFRAPASSTGAWPVADVNIENYDILVSPSVPPSERSFIFAMNATGPQVQVRSGPLLIPAGSYPFGSSPNGFGPAIEFAQPYAYTGGHLLVEIRHTGFTGTSRSVDALTTSVAGYATQFSAMWVGNYTATVADFQANFSIMEFTVAPGGTPCYANCDSSTTPPILNVEDFTCFINEFAGATVLPHEQQLTHYANCDLSTTAPVLNVEDFSCFINKFAAGCP
jgi:hypothetical protein